MEGSIDSGFGGEISRSFVEFEKAFWKVGEGKVLPVRLSYEFDDADDTFALVGNWIGFAIANVSLFVDKFKQANCLDVNTMSFRA